jgi:hypothetical protein
LAKHGPNKGANNGIPETGREGEYARLETGPGTAHFYPLKTPRTNYVSTPPKHARVDAFDGDNGGCFSTSVLWWSKRANLPHFASRER